MGSSCFIRAINVFSSSFLGDFSCSPTIRRDTHLHLVLGCVCWALHKLLARPNVRLAALCNYRNYFLHQTNEVLLIFLSTQHHLWSVPLHWWGPHTLTKNQPVLLHQSLRSSLLCHQLYPILIHILKLPRTIPKIAISHKRETNIS